MIELGGVGFLLYMAVKLAICVSVFNYIRATGERTTGDPDRMPAYVGKLHGHGYVVQFRRLILLLGNVRPVPCTSQCNASAACKK